MTQNIRSDPNPILSVIIVSYNVLDALQSGLMLLKPFHDQGKGDIWVIDNASRDATADWVEQQQWPHLIRNSENLGFAAAVNQGIERSRGAFILLLNPDTTISEAAIKGMRTFMDTHEECGIAGVQLLNPDQSLQKSYHYFPTPRSFIAESLFLNRVKPDENGFEKPVRVDAVVGACMMIRRTAIEHIGLFDERFFLYSEELDWCLRARQAGWNVYLLPEVRVIHNLAQSSKDDPGNAFVELYRSRGLYMDKHFSNLGRSMVQISFFTGVLLRVILWRIALWIIRRPDKKNEINLKYSLNKAVLIWYLAGRPNPHLR